MMTELLESKLVPTGKVFSSAKEKRKKKKTVFCRKALKNDNKLEREREEGTSEALSANKSDWLVAQFKTSEKKQILYFFFLHTPAWSLLEDLLSTRIDSI
jgi:hypothetical protein